VIDPLRPVAALFPTRSRRWVADTCRAGRVPGAIKVGREWLISESAAAAFVGGAAPGAAKAYDVHERARALGFAA